MSIFKLTASADTTLTNAFMPDQLTRATNSNMGAADSLEVFSSYYSSSSGLDPQLSRILVRFPIEQIGIKRTTGVLPESGSVSHILKLYNVEHAYSVPAKFSVIVAPISASEWVEGNGIDQDYYTDTGYNGESGEGASWEYKTIDRWANMGGDFYTSSAYAKSFYFDTGLEDLEVDVTDIVEAQLSGVILNSGFGILLSGSFENPNSETDYYTKKFSARSSEYFFKRPALESRWKSQLRDDRGNFYFSSPNLSEEDNKQSLYFYNRVNGTLKDIPNSVTPQVIFEDDTNQVYGTGSVSKISTGIYKCEALLTGSEEVDLIDTWYSGSNVYFQGEVTAQLRKFEDSPVQDEYVFSIQNLKMKYSQSEKPNLRIYSRKKNWSPNVYTVSNKDIETYTHKNLYYKVFRIVDGYTVIDYGISPIEYTLCSYDKNGNYFDLDMSYFEPGYGYSIKLMLLSEGTKKEYREVFKFKVE
jgi:hypothetical protein